MNPTTPKSDETGKIMSMLSKDNPIMVAWEAYTQTGDYSNSRKWATMDEHVDGSLWAAFLEGWTRHDSVLKSQNERLVRALQTVFDMIDKSELVRNIEQDSRGDWAMRLLDFGRKLQSSHATLEQADGMEMEIEGLRKAAETLRRHARNQTKNMKLLVLSLLLSAFAAKAQQPPIVSCISNAIITLTDTNAYFHDTGSGLTNSSTGEVTTVIDYNGCHTNDTVIGMVILQCDIARNCSNGPVFESCPSDNLYPITLPAFCNGITIQFHSFYRCCDLVLITSDPQHCDPQDGHIEP